MFVNHFRFFLLVGFVALYNISAASTIEFRNTVTGKSDPRVSGEDVVFKVYFAGSNYVIHQKELGKGWNSFTLGMPEYIADARNGTNRNAESIIIKVKAPNLIELPCKMENGDFIIRVVDAATQDGDEVKKEIHRNLDDKLVTFTYDVDNWLNSSCSVKINPNR